MVHLSEYFLLCHPIILLFAGIAPGYYRVHQWRATGTCTASQLLRRYYGGHVVIRMSLGGCTNRPFYRIVAAYNQRARDGRHFDKLGSYDPMPNVYNEKLVSLNIERIKYWIASGAQVTKPVAKLLGLAGFFPLHPMTITASERLRRAQEETAGEEPEGHPTDEDRGPSEHPTEENK